jgi:hypothetical protein
MYEDQYYDVYFTMNTPDDKKISEMSYSELYWLLDNLNSYVERIRGKVKERREVLYEEGRKEDFKKLADRYLDIIEAGVGRKCKKNNLKAYDILLDIFFHKTDFKD